MKWSRERDYHGYRSYSEEARMSGGIAARLIAAFKSALNSLAKPTPAPISLGDRNRRGYSTLGAARGSKQSAELPFPTAPADATQARRS